MLSKSIWLGLKQSTRKIIADKLGLKKDVGSVVDGGRVVSDGYSDNALSAIDLKKLQAVMGSKEKDFYKLFNDLVTRVETPTFQFMRTLTPEELKASEELVKKNETVGAVKLSKKDKKKSKK